MISFINALPGAMAQGLIWGIMAIGVYITFRLLDIADLTVDGSFCTGGAVCAMLITNGYPVWQALVLAAAGVCFLCLVGFQGRAGQQYVPVDVLYDGRAVSLMALVDSGNTLRDPVTGCPVLVVEAASAKKLLSFAEGELEHPLETMLARKHQNLRLIPYTAVGQPGGFLLAIRPDCVRINGKTMDHLVAFTPQNLGHGQYQALAGGML